MTEPTSTRMPVPPSSGVLPAPRAPRPMDLRALVEAYADFVWRSVRRLGVPESAADDATQQVFATVAGKLDAVEPGRERAFLFGIAANVAAHARRAFARRRETSDGGQPDAPDPGPSAEDLVDRRRARALLDAVLDELPDDLRTVFVLFELEEMPTVQIAEIIGVPIGTVASRLRRAREEFQRAAQRARARHERVRRAGGGR